MTRVLIVRDLHLAVRNGRESLPILRGINMHLAEGEIHGLVGESGAGKTMLGRVILEILPPSAVITSGSVDYPAHESSPSLGRKTGHRRLSHISLIPQDPMTSLNPVLTIGEQLIETLLQHKSLNKNEKNK